jgi:hypothetical protein
MRQTTRGIKDSPEGGKYCRRLLRQPEEAREAFGTAGSPDTKQQCFPIKNGDCEMKHQGFVVKVISDNLVLVDTGKRSSPQYWRIDTSRETARLGNHKCGMQNAAVTFDFDGRAVKKFSIDLPDHDGEQEISTIIFARREHTPSGGFGFLRRNDCGCSIHFSHSSVVTWGDIEIGAEAQHGIDIDIDGRAIAVEVKLFQQ